MVGGRAAAGPCCKGARARSHAVCLGEQHRLGWWMLEGRWGPVPGSPRKGHTLPPLLSRSFCTTLWASLAQVCNTHPGGPKACVPPTRSHWKLFFCAGQAPDQRPAAARALPLSPQETGGGGSWPCAAAPAGHRAPRATPKQKLGSQRGVGRAVGCGERGRSA